MRIVVKRLLIRGSLVQVQSEELDFKGFMNVKLRKPFFLAKNLQKLKEKRG